MKQENIDLVERSNDEWAKVWLPNAKIIRDVLQHLERTGGPIDHDTAVKVIELYIENENAVQKHLEDYRKVFIEEAWLTVRKSVKL